MCLGPVLAEVLEAEGKTLPFLLVSCLANGPDMSAAFCLRNRANQMD